MEKIFIPNGIEDCATPWPELPLTGESTELSWETSEITNFVAMGYGNCALMLDRGTEFITRYPELK